ncbi:hypothetical protein SS50377_22960 [Spironucleus salmonicida]|uniref:Uncharacterized protein n=1 Tax=Spironucleus salmonicida TaxID=348837 RepID=V6M3V4_9EUKA|nr:hypothetical protein SS50377_22960 [Spironucleus salmonicida]|eukprot:EST47994.1 Hypothetical protein SS50377_fx028 [Spironucleus salmonicida]
MKLFNLYQTGYIVQMYLFQIFIVARIFHVPNRLQIIVTTFCTSYKFVPSPSCQLARKNPLVSIDTPTDKGKVNFISIVPLFELNKIVEISQTIIIVKVQQWCDVIYDFRSTTPVLFQYLWFEVSGWQFHARLLYCRS